MGFYNANSHTSAARTGSAPGCTNGCGDGSFTGDCTTGCDQQCPGCGGDWCCDCEGCRPGKCDDDPANDWCQDYYDTYGTVAAGCPPPNDDPCYEVDPTLNVLIPVTDNCACPGAPRVYGTRCNPDTGNNEPIPPTVGTPRPDDEDPAPDDDPDGPTTTKCYVKSVEVFGDFNYHEIPCKCRGLSGLSLKNCIDPPDQQDPVEKCECGSISIDNGPPVIKCGKTLNGSYTGEECDLECHCHADCNFGEQCNQNGVCV